MKNTNFEKFDLNGRIMKDEYLNIIRGFNKNSIDISNLQTGLYLVQLNLDYKKLFNHKIIIVR